MSAESIYNKMSNSLKENGDDEHITNIIRGLPEFCFNDEKFEDGHRTSSKILKTTITKEQVISMISFLTIKQKERIFEEENSENIYIYLEEFNKEEYKEIEVLIPEMVLIKLFDEHDLKLTKNQVLDMLKCLNKHQLTFMNKKLKDVDFTWY